MGSSCSQRGSPRPPKDSPMNLIPGGHRPMGEQFFPSSVTVSWGWRDSSGTCGQARSEGLSHMLCPGLPLTSMTGTSPESSCSKGTLNRTAFPEEESGPPFFPQALAFHSTLLPTQPSNDIISMIWGSLPGPGGHSAVSARRRHITGWLGKAALSHRGGLCPPAHAPNPGQQQK